MDCQIEKNNHSNDIDYISINNTKCLISNIELKLNNYLKNNNQSDFIEGSQNDLELISNIKQIENTKQKCQNFFSNQDQKYSQSIEKIQINEFEAIDQSNKENQSIIVKQSIESIKEKLQEMSLKKNSFLGQSQKKFNKILECSSNTKDNAAINDSVLTRLTNLEEIYKKKIEIFEKRVQDLEDENLCLQSEKQALTQNNLQLQNDLKNLSDQFQKDLSEKISELENKIKKDYEKSIKKQEKNFQNQTLLQQQEIEELKKQQQELIEQIKEQGLYNQELCNQNEQCSQSYNNLLSIHNQMIQIDIKKNQKSLMQSENSTSFIHSQVYNKSRQNHFLNDDFLQKNDDSQHLLIEQLTGYGSELEKLKQYNQQIQSQFEDEIIALKNELQQQQQLNHELYNQLQQSQRMEEDQEPLKNHDQIKNLQYTVKVIIKSQLLINYI